MLDGDLSHLPSVQRRALDAALLRAQDEEPIQQRADSAAFLGVLRSFARECPVIVAVDDVQWLDHSLAQFWRTQPVA